MMDIAAQALEELYFKSWNLSGMYYNFIYSKILEIDLKSWICCYAKALCFFSLKIELVELEDEMFDEIGFKVLNWLN